MKRLLIILMLLCSLTAHAGGNGGINTPAGAYLGASTPLKRAPENNHPLEPYMYRYIFGVAIGMLVMVPVCSFFVLCFTTMLQLRQEENERAYHEDLAKQREVAHSLLDAARKRRKKEEETT